MSSFAPLFVPDELLEAVSGRAWLAAMLESERALAQAGAEAGIVPADQAAAIASACAPDDFDWEALLREARQVGNPAEPLVRALVARVAPETARWVHLGATSQDVMDTAAMLVTRHALSLVLGDLDRVAAACAGLARSHRDTPMVGRTLMQQAVPTTFGLKAAGWLTALLDARSRLGEIRRSGLAAQLGGAAGTLAALGEHGPEVARLYAGELGLEEATIPWHANRVRVAEVGTALEIVAGVLAKIAVDLVLLSQTEVGEVQESGTGVSSAMPQKRNAVGAISTRACAALVEGHARVLVGSLASEHERAAGLWQAEWEALSAALAMTGGAAASLASALEGLEVSAERMLANLELTGGQVVTERVALLLTERLDRTTARELVRDVSLRAGQTGRPIADVLAEADTGLTGDEIEAALDPATYLGSAGAFVDRALARYAADGVGGG